MIEHLDLILEKYNKLEAELTKAEVLSDVKKTREYSKDQEAIDSLKQELEAKGREIYDIDIMREQSARSGVIQ